MDHLEDLSAEPAPRRKVLGALPKGRNERGRRTGRVRTLLPYPLAAQALELGWLDKCVYFLGIPFSSPEKWGGVAHCDH